MSHHKHTNPPPLSALLCSASVVPSISNTSSNAVSAAYSANLHSAYDPLSWKGRLVVKAGGKEARAWFKISRPLARPADPYPLEHDDYHYSHARERITCAAVGKAMSAAITRQVCVFFLSLTFFSQCVCVMHAVASHELIQINLTTYK
jgi:hypothetical protein